MNVSALFVLFCFSTSLKAGKKCQRKITNADGTNLVVVSVVAVRGAQQPLKRKPQKMPNKKVSAHNWSEHVPSFLLYDGVYKVLEVPLILPLDTHNTFVLLHV